MKIERVSDNMIKVTVSISDLEARNIDLGSLNYNSPAAQELFWDMMEQAELQYGFSAYDSQLLIEPRPDDDEGFIITITRVDEDGDFESIHKFIKSKYKRSDVRLKKKSKKVLSTLLIYSFSNFDDMTMLCKKLETVYLGESTVYKCRDTYYLALSRSNFDVQDIKSLELQMGEYGKKVANANFYEGYLNEYGVKIAEYNAIEIMNKYF